MRLRSSTPGRQRWECEELYANPERAMAVESALAERSSIIEARANPRTGRVLIRFASRFDERWVVEHLRSAMMAPLPGAAALSAWRARRPPSSWRVWLSRALLGVVVGKHLVWGTGALARSRALLATSASITIVLGYPMLVAWLRRVASPRALGAVGQGLSLIRESEDGLAVAAVSEWRSYRWRDDQLVEPTMPAISGAVGRTSSAFLLFGLAVFLVTGDGPRTLATLQLACPCAAIDLRDPAGRGERWVLVLGGSLAVLGSLGIIGLAEANVVHNAVRIAALAGSTRQTPAPAGSQAGETGRGTRGARSKLLDPSVLRNSRR